jgi:putative transposase
MVPVLNGTCLFYHCYALLPEDFMNLSQTAVTNAANLAFFMVNLSHHLLSRFRQNNPDSGVIDLKA